MLKRKLPTLFLVCLFLTVSVNAYAQIPNIQVSQDESALNIVESFFNTGESISRIDRRPDSGEGAILCDSQTLLPCTGAESMGAYIVLPPCSTEILEWCIDGVSIYRKSNISVIDSAKLLRSTSGPVVRKNADLDLPQGGTISLWQADGSINKGGTKTYAAYAMIKGGKPAGGGKFTFHSFTAMVFPYSERTGNNYQEGSLANFTDNQGRQNISISGGSPECAWTEKSKCGYIEDFADGTRAKLSVRVGNSLSGWLMGRMSDPIIEVKQLSSSQNLLIVDSEPVAVPKFQKKISTGAATQELLAVDPQVKFGGMHNQLASASLGTFLAWSKLVDDRANGLETVWSISTTANGFGSQCLQDRSKLLGLVSTNAMVYEGTAPNYVNSTLQYKVAGLHNNSDGTPFLGKYDLLMRSEVARCIYGLPNIPISAEISITSSDGNEKVATTVMNESNGWLRLGAYGFTFSNPIISVKLGKENSLPISNGKPVATEPTSAATPIASPNPEATQLAIQATPSTEKKISVVCTNKKKTVRVTSVSPKCPAGYRKK